MALKSLRMDHHTALSNLVYILRQKQEEWCRRRWSWWYWKDWFWVPI
ncbi:hypothetical protein MTR67_035151 [Solanum verrucosum]|uniref:Uncharacterized protein n=1 Tax=Solanum verrucosum TaxID=315347 RepID=A0AAF0U9S2_SOLVR|nr:hypothetical protein MTR67_035151 [Solanum verrucosum]